jgi:hypothetical protein
MTEIESTKKLKSLYRKNMRKELAYRITYYVGIYLQKVQMMYTKKKQEINCRSLEKFKAKTIRLCHHCDSRA